MRQHKAALSLAISCMAVLPLITHAAEPRADLLVLNAHIKTMDPRCPEAEAMAIRQGKIVAIGTNSELKAKGAARIYDAEQKLILPGLHDSHVHLAEGSVEFLQLNLKNSKDKKEILLHLASYNNAHPRSDCIVGNGLPLPALIGDKLTRHDLDRVTSTKPVVLHSEDGHSVWLNSKAIELIKPDTLAKLSGQESSRHMLERLEDGSLSGVFREQALIVADDVTRGPSPAERAIALKDAVKMANSFGITSIQDAHATPDVVDSYQRLAKSKSLNLRVTLALHTDTSDPQAQVEALKALRAKINKANSPEILKATGAKIFVDGVIETGTAALLAPYLKPINPERAEGQANLTAQQLDALVAQLVAADFNIHLHAIGDRAVRMALDSLAPQIQKSKSNNLRHQIAHLELIDKADVARFKQLNVTANWQSFWAFRDPYIEQLTIPQLGDERSSRLYPMQEVAATGARLAAGSDWTVSTLNPLDAMQVAVTRQSISAQDRAPLNSKEALTLEQILRAYTTGGAWVNCSNSYTGTLSPGKLADFVVFDRDFIKGKPEDIHKALVVRTYLAGKPVYIR